jgi:uncharacterized BrkB/YihY/UPF0761 family membrane protein
MVSVALFALVTAVLNLLFRFTTTFGSTYGPLAGLVALLFWTYAVSVALLAGAAFGAQAEAIRAGVPAPRRDGDDERAAPGPGAPPGVIAAPASSSTAALAS